MRANGALEMSDGTSFRWTQGAGVARHTYVYHAARSLTFGEFVLQMQSTAQMDGADAVLVRKVDDAQRVYSFFRRESMMGSAVLDANGTLTVWVMSLARARALFRLVSAGCGVRNPTLAFTVWDGDGLVTGTRAPPNGYGYVMLSNGDFRGAK